MKTKTTELSKSSRCIIRHKEIVLTPEERVRQALLEQMIHKLGYPKGLISVERGIGGRRTDVVCFTKEVMPLLLIECKAAVLNEAAMQQMLGYNEKVGAPFMALVNNEKVITFWFENKTLKQVPFLPAYKELIHA